jgi:FtsH-binding integral membrane protein
MDAASFEAPSSTEYQEPKNASALPLFLVIFAVLASSLIQLFKYDLANNLWFVLGYILTPVVTILALGWDTKSQLSGQHNPWFVAKPLYSNIIRVFVVLSLIVSALHIIEIGTWLGQQAVQSGWFS